MRSHRLYSALLILIAFESSVSGFRFSKKGPKTRQNIEYAEAWEETNDRTDPEQSNDCTCMSVTKCGASLRAGDDSEENMCPTDGDVCCIVSGEQEGIRVPPEVGREPETQPEIPQSCNCVPITECGGSLRVEDDNEEPSEENVCANPSEVCCEPPGDQQPKPEKPTTAGTKPGNGGIGQNIEPTATDPPYECGKADTNISFFPASQDLTEQSAKFGEFPWTVLLYVRNPDDANNGIDDYKCAGALIHPQLVLTAAHCLDKQDLLSLTVRAGEWDIFQTQEPVDFQEAGIESIKPHPNFVSGSPLFDLAVIVLTRPFNLGHNVKVICLPNYSLDEVNVNDCISAGWGKSPNGIENGVLKKIVMPIVDSKTCQAALRTTRLGKYFKLHKSFLCAGGRADQDVCQGDGGGPLSCRAPDGAMVLVGVTSWGVGCGKAGIPGVFANVLFLNSWLNDVLVQISKESSYS